METDIITKLNRYKSTLENKKGERQRLQGHQDSLMNHLEELGFSSVENAERGLEALAVQIDKMTEDFELLTKKFEENYGDILK